MAFRLGYQISCNLHNNVLIRSASVGSSRRFRCLSPSCLYGQLKDNVIPNASLAAAFLHQRSRPRVPTEGFKISSMIKTLRNYPTYRNFSQIRPDDEQEAAEVVFAQNSSPSKPYFNILKIRKGPITHRLQPKNINPVATVNINLNSFVPFEEKIPHNDKFNILRKQAQSQYLKAVRNLNKKDEPFSYRYKLEAANPKPASENVFNEIDVRKKLQHAVHNTVPQLQPKNIKPFGNITNVQWRAPNVEKVKQGYVVYQTRNERSDANENSVAVKKGDSDRDISKNLSTQQREYCTTQMSANDNEKCNNIKTEYKKINSDYTENQSFPPSVNPESKQPIENNAMQVADESPQTGVYNKQNIRYMLYMSGGSVYSKRIPEEPDSTIYSNNYFKPLNETTIFHRSKANARPITVKLGPKWKLQSTGGPDIVESVGPLNPGANEKFVVPWPSYAERIKTSKTPRLPKPLTSIADVDEASNVLKDKYNAMYNKIQSDTNALFLKPSQNIPSELGSSNKQSISVLNREYSTGLRRSEVGKEQRGFFKMRKSSDYYQVLSKISDIQEKRYASYRGLSMKPLLKNKMKSKLKQLSKSEVPQLRMNVPVSDPMTKLPIIHHMGKAAKAKLSRETLFEHIRNKLKSQARNQSDPQRSDTLAKPYGGYMFSRQRSLNSVPGKVPMMMFSTLTRVQPGHQDISFSRSVCVGKTCFPSRTNESLRILRSHLRPLNAPDYPQVCDEGLLSQLKSNNSLSKQNLNSMYSFKRSLSNLEESKANHANIFESIWAKVTEYFRFLNTFKVPQVCFECDSQRPARDLQGGLLSGDNFFSSGRKYSANCSQTTGLYSVPSRNYSLFDKFEARRKRRKEPCPCVRKKLSDVMPPLKRLPKHPPMDRPPYKCEPPCVDMKTFRADVIAHLETERKSLPKLEPSDCPCPEKPKSDVPQPKLKRLPKIKYEVLQKKCAVLHCVVAKRADGDLKIEKKTLPVLVPGKLPALEKQPPKHLPASLKRLPKAPFIDRPPYKCELPCVDLALQRADFLAKLTVKPKILPKLEFGDCPCPVHKADTPQSKLKRLPKPPPEDRVWECRDVDVCAENEKYRADRGLDFSKKKSLPILVAGKCPPEDDIVCPPESKGKTTASIFKNNNRKFSTMANRSETVHEHRCFSTKSQKGNEPKECKKLIRSTKKQCKKLTLVKCEPAKSISCKRKLVRLPCTKTNSPYPSFSECKDEDDVPPLTECDTRQKHLQPKWPLINDIVVLKPPPPKQGKIDPSKEERCVMQKLNLTRSGTKTCENFYAPEKSFNAKEMLAKHKEEEDEDDDGDECEGSSKPDRSQEEKAPPKEDVCVKRTKSKSADLCGVKSKSDSPTEQEKASPKSVCSLPKHEKPCQAPINAIKSQDQSKLTAKDICDLTKKKVGPKGNKKSSLKVTCPPKGFFQRILEFFFGKPSQPKPLLSEKPKKVSSTSKLCKKGTTAKTKPVFCYSKASSAAKKKPKKKDICNTSKSNAKPSKEHKPLNKSEQCKPLKESKECNDKKKTAKKHEKTLTSKTKEPSHKILDVTKAALCADEREKEKSKKKAEKVDCEKETKKSTHKITELTKATPCPDECEEPKKEDLKSSEIKKTKHKIAGVTQVALCPDELEGGEILEEGGEDWNEGDNAKCETGSGKCKIPSYKNCPPKARESCKTEIKRPPCKAKEPPYSSFSECHEDFPKLPISECTEQDKRLELSREHKKTNNSEEEKL